VRPIQQPNNDLINQLEFSQDGSRLYTWTAGSRPIMGVWNLDRGELITRYTDIIYRGFSRDKRYAWTGGKFQSEYQGDPNTGIVRFWDAPNRTNIRSVRGNIDWDNSEVMFLDFSPIRDILGQETIYIVDVGTSEILKSYDNSQIGYIRNAIFMPEGGNTLPGALEIIQRGSPALINLSSTLVVSATFDNRLILWNLTTGFAVRDIGIDDRTLQLREISPDGRYVLTVSEDGSARVWTTVEETTEKHCCL
jgi:WD40 repeat protein